MIVGRRKGWGGDGGGVVGEWCGGCDSMVGWAKGSGSEYCIGIVGITDTVHYSRRVTSSNIM